MIQYATEGNESFDGKRVAISGSGNVAQYAALKAIELGAIIISLSDSKGSIIAKEGKSITPAMISRIAELKVKRQAIDTVNTMDEYKDKITYIKNDQPWTHVQNVDVALPSATQNEVSGSDAAQLLKNGCRYIAEGSNMGCTQDAIDEFETVRKDTKGLRIWYAPGRSPAPPLRISTILISCRQSCERWWRCCVRAGDGAEQSAAQMDS